MKTACRSREVEGCCAGKKITLKRDLNMSPTHRTRKPWKMEATLITALLTGFPTFSSLNTRAVVPTAGTVAATDTVGGTKKAREASAAASDSISGTVMDHSSNQPITGATVVLEQPDGAGIDRIVATTTTVSGGVFIFTGLQAGNYYDVVADASLTSSSGATQTYAATVTFRVPVGTMLRRVPLVSEFGDASPNGQPVLISATVTTSGSTGGPAQADINLSALQSAALEDGTTVQVTVPPFSGSTPRVTTSPSPECASGTSCAKYVLSVPSSDPVYGTFHLSGTNYVIPTPEPAEVIYHIEGKAFLPGTNTPDCNPSTQTSGQVVPRGTLPSMIPNLDFTGCQE